MWLDYLSSIFLIIYTIIVIVYVFILLIKGKRFPPLIPKNPSLTCGIIIFGLIHSWSAFISGDHFEFVKNIETKSCVLWIWWIQYFLGLSIWYSLFLLRTIDYGLIFNPDILLISWSVVKKIRLLVFIALNIPIVVLCILITKSDGCSYSYYLNECNTLKTYKIMFGFWVIGCIMLIIIVCVGIRLKEIKSDEFNEYTAFKQIIALFMVCMAINITLTLLDLLSNEYGRNIFTITVIILHLFADLRYVWYVGLKSINNDNTYTLQYLSESDKIAPIDYSPECIKLRESLASDFVEYCRNRHSITITLNIHNKKSITVPTARFSDCYNEIKNWKLNFDVVTEGIKDKRLQGIIDIYHKYLYIDSANSIFYNCDSKCLAIPQDPTIDYFHDIEEYILNHLIVDHGHTYINYSLWNRTEYLNNDIHVLRWIKDVSAQEIMERMVDCEMIDIRTRCKLQNEDLINDDDHSFFYDENK